MAGEAVPLEDLPSGSAVPAGDLPEGYQPPSAAVVARSAGALGRKAVGAARKILAQRDDDVDYTGIGDPGAQAKYSLLSKPEDRTEFLKQRYGAENVTKDSYGHDVVIRDGKKFSFLAKEETSKNLGSQYAALTGEVAPTAGIIAGGVVGAPLGPVGGAVFAGGGGATGVATNQLIARGLGLPVSQSTDEAARSIVTEGIFPGALAESGSRLLGYAGRTAMGPYQPGSVFGPWERTQELWEEQMREVAAARGLGLRPHLAAAAPNARLLQRFQGMSARIFGDELPRFNRPILERNVNQLTGEAAGGAVEPRLRAPEELNVRLGERAGMIQGSAQQETAFARAAAEREIQAGQEALTRDVGVPSGKLATNVADDIRAARARFGERASTLYKPIDDLAGKPLVPTDGLKGELRKILEENPLAKPGEVFAKSINDLPPLVTFQQMQAIRSTLSSKTEAVALNAGLGDRQIVRLASSADRAFGDAEQLAARLGTTQDVAGTVNALRRADQFYKAGIKRFDEMTSQALVKDATRSGFIEPEKVARYIATPGQTDKLLRIKRVVSQQTFVDIGNQTWANILRDSADPLTGQVSGQRLSAQLAQYSKNRTLDVLFGEQAPRMRQLAAQFAALDGKIAVADLEQGNIRTAIENALAKQKESDRIMSQTWLQAIKTEGPQSLQAAEWLTQPGNRLALRSAIREFGPASDEAKALREYLARRLFATMEQPAQRGAEKYARTELMGAPLQKELDRYGADYLNDIFGREWTTKVQAFAKAAESGTRKNPTDAGGIVAAALAIRPWHYAKKLVEIFAGGELLSTTPIIDYLSKGIFRGDTAMFLRDMAMLGTRTVAAQAAVDIPKRTEEYARGVKAHVQSMQQ